MPNTLRDALNRSNPNGVPDALRALPAGEALSLLPRAEVVSLVSTIATLSVPAIALISVWGRTTGEYATIVKPETAAPAAGEACVDALGRLVYNRADQAVEVVYVAAEGVIVTETILVAASVGTLLGGKSGVKLLAASVVVGLTPGVLTVVGRGSAPAATEAALNAAGTGVAFNVADVVTGTATVTYLARPTSSVSDRMDDVSPII